MKTFLFAKALLALAVLAGGLCLAPLAAAAQAGGVKIANQVSTDVQPLFLNGAGVRKRFVFDVYAAALYTAAPTPDAQAIIHSNQPRRLQLTLLRSIDGAALLDALDEGLKANNPAQELRQMDSAIAQFREIMKSAGPGRNGDTIELDFNATGIAVSFKGRELGQVKDPHLPAALMRVWLGEKPAQESLKQALLGRK
ncbi:MAG: chalcone isomerase family protein [Pollutimonas bauzanensis]|uniref:Chalcone isomerase-like n=1 Tax=Pollutimonas bauzanensis TaxID=658167 RepID=A0A1M6B8J5_9BURK|nr:chalcone isomerase family protein [Pollutimonas bauzanensis]SHI45020.1 Chalcone isomerase-like [Pollutimonas bauzanensis]